MQCLGQYEDFQQYFLHQTPSNLVEMFKKLCDQETTIFTNVVIDFHRQFNSLFAAHILTRHREQPKRTTVSMCSQNYSSIPSVESSGSKIAALAPPITMVVRVTFWTGIVYFVFKMHLFLLNKVFVYIHFMLRYLWVLVEDISLVIIKGNTVLERDLMGLSPIFWRLTIKN